MSFGRANITAPTPGLRKTRTAKIVKCPEKASKVLETPQGSRFCSKIRRFRPGISNAWHAFEICAPGIAGRGPATLFFARPGAAHLADFAPGDTRGGPQCRGNARKRPPKPPIWRKKVPWSSAFSAGTPQRPLPAQVTGGAASKKPKTQQNYSVFPINELFSFRHHTDGVWMSASSC